jgi:hypothetical protein
METDSRKRAAYAQLCMVDDAVDQIDEARPFDEMRDELVKKLRAAWDKDGNRTALIHVENTNAAFVHATVAVMESEAVRRVWPYWHFNAVMDQKTSQLCDALNDTVRPAAESWWYDGRIPPLHFGGCRSLILGITMKEAHRIGVTPYYPVVQGDVHHGYGYSRRGFEPDLSKFPAELTQIYDQAMREQETSALEEFAAGVKTTWPRKGGGRLRAIDAFKLQSDDDEEIVQFARIRENVQGLYQAAIEMADAVVAAVA